MKAPPPADLRSALDGLGLRASAATTRPTATRRSARTPSRRATTAMPAAWIITSRAIRWLASRSPAAAPIGAWRKASAADAATRSRPASTASTRSGPAYVAAALAFANHWMTTNRIAFRAISSTRVQRAELWRPHRDRLSLCPLPPPQAGRLADRRHALRGPAGAKLPHPELQRDRSHRRRLRPELQRYERDRHAERTRLTLRRSYDCQRHAAVAARRGSPGRMIGSAIRRSARCSRRCRARLHRQRRNGAEEFRAHVRRRRPAPHANWTLTAKFDGEFASGSQTYAGTGTLRYAW